MKKSDILEKYPPLMQNILLLLHDFQDHNPRNYLSQRDLALIAGHLKTTCGLVYGVASYYSMFSLKPRGKHIITICDSPVCHMTGASGLFSPLNKLLAIAVGETTPDGLFTLETAECLGQCHKAPAMAVDKAIYGNLTPAKIETILGEYTQQRNRSRRKPGP